MLKISIKIPFFRFFSLTVLNEPSPSSGVISCSALQVCVCVLDNQMIENFTQFLLLSQISSFLFFSCELFMINS